MSNVAIEINNLSKQYRLGKVGTGTFYQDVNELWHKLRGKENPYLKVGDVNDRTKAGGSDLVWALHDISFKVNKGEVLGIVGKNGAGKSTLLKILSRVTGPTLGDIKIKGRIASLLEVGTGFHPDLPGRENIFLNGAILGMTKAEIKSKFDEIVAFSGVEKYIDTPVKRYSSGMYVRLAFAVAAHLEPEILIVDEVLAVGDAEFQKKCIGKMKSVSGDGRTIIFVSHNLTAVRSLCPRSILLEKGGMVMDGDSVDVIGRYLGGKSAEDSQGKKVFDPPHTAEGKVKIHSIAVSLNGDVSDPVVPVESAFAIEIEAETLIESKFNFSLQFVNVEGEVVFASGSGMLENFDLKAGRNIVKCHIPANFFNAGTVGLNLIVTENKRESIMKSDEILQIVFVDKGRELGQWMGRSPGIIKPKFEWTC